MAANPESGFTNSILKCVDCQEEFVFTASAQKYFAERGFLDPPKRCRACYTEFKNQGGEPSEPPVPPVPPPDMNGGSKPHIRG